MDSSSKILLPSFFKNDHRKSMNNSEFSTSISSEGVFTDPQSFAYTTSWRTFPGESVLDKSVSRNESSDGGVIEYLGAAINQDDLGALVLEPGPRSDVSQPDFGFWLLYDSGTHHDQWERVRKAVQRNVGVRFSSGYWPVMLKRCFDFAGSLLLIFALLPLFLLISIAIKLDSTGPIFFRHDRVGKNGKHFVLWKFRSMRTNVPKYETSPRSPIDVRLTRVGRWIRRLSFDEMPQLINVLKGEMSLVGPRPEMPFIVARYRPTDRERLVLKPGITGLWQISPARAFPIHENLYYDLHYIRNQNFVLDCIILLRTITAVIHGVGAV
jgi:lipopolysaccharide/colanic/teichoic acid biosynthesis glycosyltransferase